MKSIRRLVIALVVVLSAALLVVPAFAQDNTPTPPTAASSSNVPHRPFGQGNATVVTTRTITITQEQINDRLANRSGKWLKDLSILLGDNEVTVSFTTSGILNNDTGRAVVAVVTPSVADGKLNWTLSSLTIDGTAATQEQMDALKNRVTNLITGRLAQRERHFSVTGVTVDTNAITITLTRNKSA